MSNQHHRLKKKQEQEHANRSQDESRQSNPAKTPESRPGILQAGNAAINELLSSAREGKQLEPGVRTQMEEAFGTHFGDVRVHDNPSAQAKAKKVGARAFTRGRDIYLGRSAPSPESNEGKKLLAHELAHVVQQDEASAIDHSAVSQPGDKLEQTADLAATQALSGQKARMQSSGVAPGVQRDPERVSRAEVQAALTEFLERARQAQGGQLLRVTTEVRNAVEMLARAPGPMNDTGRAGPNEYMRLTAIQVWLNGGLLPGRPADFARELARRLPDPFDAAALERLRSMPVSPTTSTVGRVRDLIERSAPGQPDRPEPVREPTSQERFERGMADQARQSGRPQPTTVGPYSVDILRMGRILGGFRGAVQGPPRPQRREPEARSYPEVEQAVRQVSNDALVPAEARGQETAGNFAGAQDVARQLARLLDVAQQQNQSTVDLEMGAAYENVRDLGAIAAEIGRIARLIRDALPHHATNVRTVIVHFGRTVRWIPLTQAAGTE
jgi:uncharacterized protein DUF4157